MAGLLAILFRAAWLTPAACRDRSSWPCLYQAPCPVKLKEALWRLELAACNQLLTSSHALYIMAGPLAVVAQGHSPSQAQCSAHRCLQDEMLGGAKDAGGVEWSVLILDPFTTKIMSNACRISEILDYGISCEQSHAAV